MNLENVRYLLAALEAGSFSGAAERLGLTASGINRQVSALEEELGTALLLRSRRCVLPAQGAELLETEFVAWLPPDHPLSLKDAITAQDLAGEPFIYPRAHHKSDIDDFLARHKLAPAVRLETNAPYSAYAMVAAGLGVSVNNRLQAANLKEKVVLKSFTPAERVTIGMALPSMASASPDAIRFVALAQQRRAALAQSTRGVRQ